MVRRFTIVIFVALLVLCACKGKQQAPSSSVTELVRDMARTNVLMGAAVGLGGECPKQWENYEALRAKASDRELLTLTDDTNAVVRCYAFDALAERKADLFPVLLRHLSDTATVRTLYGCEAATRKVGDYFLEKITASGENFYGLNESQRAVIDSALLFNPANNLKARDKLLVELGPLERYYTTIRRMAREGNKTAVVALSKYRKAQDKPRIIELLKYPNSQAYGFAAAVNFPDASFFPLLQQALKNEVTKNNGNNNERLGLLYRAIVQYKDQASRQLLQSVLSEAKGIQSIYQSDYLHQALTNYPASIYAGLIK